MLTTTSTINHALTHTTIKKLAPSIFQSAPQGHLSTRYNFIPTIALVNEIEKPGCPDGSVFSPLEIRKGLLEIAKHNALDAKGKFDNANQTYKAGVWGNDHQHRPMKMACEAAGLEYISFHELRHTYASTLINNGCPLLIVASQLGHSDTRMVEKHYGHLANDAKQAALLAAMPTYAL